MSKNIAPLFGFDAGGQLGKALVYSKWRGIPYTRRYVIPSNPNTTNQATTRSMFRTANSMWLLMPTLGVAPWAAYATGKPYTDRNAWVGRFISAFRGPPALETMATLVASPGARGGIPPSTVVAAGNGTLTATLTAPSAPTGWSVTSADGIAFVDQDPVDPWTQTILSDTQDTPSGQDYSLDFGTPAAGDYIVCAWIVWTKPDTTTAFSISLNDTATVT